MASETFRDSEHRSWSVTELRTPLEDLRRNAAFGFVRLARLAEMSMPLTQAYDIRLHPDTHLLLGDLTETLSSLEPADLGRFVALDFANSAQHIYSKASSAPGEPGLTLTVPDAPLYQKGPERDWCDADGNQHRVLRAPSIEYGRALQYVDDLDKTIDTLFQQQFASDQSSVRAYQEGWASAGNELVADHATYQTALRDNGPIFELDRRTESGARMLALLDNLGKVPGSQSGGRMA